MVAWLVSGAAGTGKSTLARALAIECGGILLDLDTLTNPLLDALAGNRWDGATLRSTARPARYACLLDAAAAQVADADLVLVAPFTAELAGGAAWDRLATAVAPRETVVVWLTLPDDLRRQRLAERAEDRDDSVRPPGPVPTVDHVRIDATLPTADQLTTALAASSP